MSKKFHQLTLPTGYKSSGVSNEWFEYDVPNGDALTSAVVMGSKAYGMRVRDVSFSIVERDLNTNAYKTYSLPTIANFEFSALDTYNNDLYMWGNSADNTYYELVLYKANLNTLTWTKIAAINIQAPRPLNTGAYICEVGNGLKLVCFSAPTYYAQGNSQIHIIRYDYRNNVFKRLFLDLIPALITRGFSGLSQKIDDDTYIIGMLTYYGTYISIYTYYAGGADPVIVSNGTMPLAGNPGYIQGTQIDNRIVWVSNNAMNGVRSGYIDLLNYSITYGDTPEPKAHPGQLDFVRYQNTWIQYNINKKYVLSVLQTPPEQNPIVLRVFKGQYYSAPNANIVVDAIPAWGQPQIIIDGTERLAAADFKVSLGAYEQLTPTTINIWRD